MTTYSIKIYGERNTGTNYLEKLIDLNIEANIMPGVVPQRIMALQQQLPGNEMIRDIYFKLTFSSNLGWKHMLVKPPEKLRHHSNVGFVTLTRNPYSWLLSLYDRPYHQYYSEKPSFEEFLAIPWRTVGRENAAKELPSPIELWNIKNFAYLRLNGILPSLNIRFEDLLIDPQGVCGLICETFSCPKKAAQFVNYEKSTKGGGKDYWFYRDYYLNERWKPRLTPLATSMINERINPRLMETFRYDNLC
ncbi:MAG: hypothetical protein ACKN9T_11080 [Candidatus Methylumidiphilus sp.]